ncbi:MAG: orotate phosphoribosyltransferase [Alphaproteobacteria bacterium CG11_big_fil_rev_8_21_14_0_20_44_7]|nr:MAG: orotate phosphoribosyltransferase [Alphaproteobacteria bacterium CG11_big_fil_rev_8_21_14_0_20_44_7]
MLKEEITEILENTGAILKGHFKLSSGKHSDTYIQCARVLMYPEISEKLCSLLSEKVKKATHEIDLVVSPAMGGLVIGYEIARQLGVPQIFCERVDGKFEFRRGFEIPKNANILIVEDVVTTAKSSFETIEAIKEAGGNPIAEACLIDRSSGEHNLPFPLVSLLELNVATYDADNLPEHLQSIEAIKPGSRFLKN